MAGTNGLLLHLVVIHRWDRLVVDGFQALPTEGSGSLWCTDHAASLVVGLVDLHCDWRCGCGRPCDGDPSTLPLPSQSLGRGQGSGGDRGAASDAVSQAISRVHNVLLRPLSKRRTFLVRKRSFHLGRTSDDHGPWGDFGSTGDQGIGSDDALFTDDRAIEHRRAHSDEAFVPDLAGVDDRGVTDRDPITDVTTEIIGHVKDGVVLNIAEVTDSDLVNIASSDGIIPNTRLLTHLDITDDDGPLGDVGSVSEPGLLLQMLIQASFNIDHEQKHGNDPAPGATKIGRPRNSPSEPVTLPGARNSFRFDVCMKTRRFFNVSSGTEDLNHRFAQIDADSAEEKSLSTVQDSCTLIRSLVENPLETLRNQQEAHPINVTSPNTSPGNRQVADHFFSHANHHLPNPE